MEHELAVWESPLVVTHSPRIQVAVTGFVSLLPEVRIFESAAIEVSMPMLQAVVSIVVPVEKPLE